MRVYLQPGEEIVLVCATAQLGNAEVLLGDVLLLARSSRNNTLQEETLFQ